MSYNNNKSQQIFQYEDSSRPDPGRSASLVGSDVASSKASTKLDLSGAKPLSPLPGSSGVGETKRKLSSRHISMIGIGGGIGTGLFVGSGNALATAGPAGVLMAYIIIGMAVFGVMEALAEMSTLIPVAGSFTHFAARFVDPALGFTLGANYYYCYAIGFASELSAASSVIQYWNQDINVAVWISIMFVVAAVLNLVGVRIYGESEVVTSMIKVLAFVGLIILGVVLDLGGGPTRDRIGFRYWKDPGAFNQFEGIAGAKGRFLGFFSAFINAAFTYVGTETVVLAAGEASNPTKQIPRAARRVLWRIIFFYILGILVIGLLVPFNEPRLTNSDLYSAKSPFVIAIDRAGIKVLPHIVNAVILVSAFSAGSSYVYVASRTLYSMALDRRAPGLFRKVNRFGIPVPAVILSLAFGAFSYLGVSKGSGTAFLWLSSLSTVAGLFAWATISFSYIRFRWALDAQGYDVSTLPYRAKLQPYGSWFSIATCSIIILFSGWSTFLNGDFTATSFVTSYIGIPLFFIPLVGWKLWHKTKMIPLSEIDLDSGKLDPSEERIEPEPTTIIGKFVAWIF
ncbi:putative general amino acid permease [Violaceomyces palustris]|uniref:General amino acid permease n=1 Tax=Violaceomyces palustris TaxID=1673888 RepID=A0ACD0P4F8_9BASI|nr:putative general amino acid permease [Violaceomyces palustris]